MQKLFSISKKPPWIVCHAAETPWETHAFQSGFKQTNKPVPGIA